MSTQKWVAVLAPDRYQAIADLHKRIEQAEALGLKFRFSLEHMILDLSDRRLQWVLPDHTVAARGARFDKWFPVEGYMPGPEAAEIVRILKQSVFKTNLGGMQ